MGPQTNDKNDIHVQNKKLENCHHTQVSSLWKGSLQGFWKNEKSQSYVERVKRFLQAAVQPGVKSIIPTHPKSQRRQSQTSDSRAWEAPIRTTKTKKRPQNSFQNSVHVVRWFWNSWCAESPVDNFPELADRNSSTGKPVCIMLSKMYFVAQIGID